MQRAGLWILVYIRENLLMDKVPLHFLILIHAHSHSVSRRSTAARPIVGQNEVQGEGLVVGHFHNKSKLRIGDYH